MVGRGWTEGVAVSAARQWAVAWYRTLVERWPTYALTRSLWERSIGITTALKKSGVHAEEEADMQQCAPRHVGSVVRAARARANTARHQRREQLAADSLDRADRRRSAQESARPPHSGRHNRDRHPPTRSQAQAEALPDSLTGSGNHRRRQPKRSREESQRGGSGCAPASNSGRRPADRPGVAGVPGASRAAR